jgi:hypothetical protein
MSARSLFRAVLVAIAIVVVADLLTQRMASNSVPRQLMRAIVSAPAKIDVLGLGNSLIAAGFDPVTIEQVFQKKGRSCVAVNAGLGASGVIEHLALTRLILHDHTVQTMVYGFIDQQLATDLVKANSDLIGNHSMLYYLEPQLTLQYAPFDMVNRLSFQVYRSCALLRERSAIWTKVEKLRRRIASVGVPPQETNEFGRKADFSLLEATDSRAFVLACQRVLRSGVLSGPVTALLAQAREHGVEVIVVEMPVHPLHRERFYNEPIWKTFRTETRRAVESTGASYLDASLWITDEHLFEDHLHLSKEGAKQFSEVLAERLIEPPTINSDREKE